MTTNKPGCPICDDAKLVCHLHNPDAPSRPAVNAGPTQPRLGHDLSEGCGFDVDECTCSPATLRQIANHETSPYTNENNQYGYPYGGDAD